MFQVQPSMSSHKGPAKCVKKKPGCLKKLKLSLVAKMDAALGMVVLKDAFYRSCFFLSSQLFVVKEFV